MPIMLAMMALANPARSQDIGSAQRGSVYAHEVCADCHAVSPSQYASPISEAPTFEDIANTPGMTPTALAVWFRTPHPTMPDLIIQGENMENVIAYILSLREEK
jgi:mono/diheme cytochrome c family protein